MQNNNNFFSIKPVQSTNQNPFPLADEAGNKSASNPMHRLNGYDSTILNDKTFDKAESDKLKLEYKIAGKQKELNDINAKIKNAELYGTQNEVLSLRMKKQRFEQELYELNRQHAASNKIKKSFTGENIELPVIRKIQTFVSRNVLAKVSKKFNSIVFLGDSLEKLTDINKSVNELIEMNVPYGEKNENYEKLTEYLYRANKIHSQISKTMGK